MSNAPSDSKLKRLLARWGKRLLIIPPVLIAVGILIFLTATRAAPKLKTEAELPRVLSVISAPELDVEPRVIGFGTAQYAKKWRAVSQVSGRIKEIHAEFRPGTIILADEVLLKIDDADYRSAAEELAAYIEEKEAEISSARANQNQLRQNSRDRAISDVRDGSRNETNEVISRP